MNVESSPQSQSSGRSTLLLVGSGVLADTLAKHLATPEVEVLRTPHDRMFEAIQPGAAQLVVLVGDAAAERGAPLIRETTNRLGAEAPLTVVVTAPQIGGMSPEPTPAGAALLTPEGGMVECARRLRLMLERLRNGALEQSSLQQVADETSRKVMGARATQRIGAGVALAPAAAAGLGQARPRHQTLLGPTALGPRPASTKIEVRTHDVPEAISGTNQRSVPAIAPVVSMAVSTEAAESVEMMWGEATPTVVARARPRPQSTNFDLPPGDVELVVGESSLPEVAVPAPSLGAKAGQGQPTSHGQTPLSLSALAGAGGAVGVEVRIRTSSTQSMPKVAVPAPSGSLPPMAAGVSQAPRTEASAPSTTAIASAAREVQPPPAMRTDALVEVSLASLEPPEVSFSEAPSISTKPEAPTAAIGIPASAQPAAGTPQRRRAPRYVMVLVLVLGGGAAAAFKLMLSEQTRASAPVTPFGALAQAGPAHHAERSTKLLARAKPEGLEPSAAPAVKAAPTSAATRPAASVVAKADDDVQDANADVEDPQSDAPAPNSAVTRAARLVDEGLSLVKQGRFGIAEASYLRALKVFPNYPRALAGLVRVHLARNDGLEAVRWAKRLTKRQPTRAQNQLMLGDAHALRGDTRAARRAWLKAAKSGSAAARSRLKSAKGKA